ncbi:hypothetical protein B0H13DRAFT_545817 [Mycena leptocephala]|nr:hypothetical protein B0H13DRAFT_545817 [Mycena leptocephala]
MSEVKTNFFLTGATGYIGGTVLARFLAHPRRYIPVHCPRPGSEKGGKVQGSRCQSGSRVSQGCPAG